VLYPLRNRFARDLPGRLVGLDEGSGLMSRAQFESVLKVFKKDFGLDFSSGGQAALMNSLDKWAVTAFRLDPCFRRNFSDPCAAQVRIVAQAMLPDHTSASDFSIHLFYEPRASTLQLLQEMIRIRETYASPADKRATLGKPLGVHPILARPGGLGSDFARALKEEFLLKHLNPGNMTEIAVSFIEPNRLQPWIFFLDKAQGFSRPQFNSIFQFDPGTSDNACGPEKGRLICRKNLATGRIVDSEEKAATNPSGTTPSGYTKDGKPYLDDFLTLIQLDKDTRTYSSVTKNLPFWEGVINEIDNPKMTSPGETNCSSCHRTTSDKVRFRGVFKIDTVGGKNAYQPAQASGCTPGVGIDYNRVGMKTFNVRMFGYLHSDPIVSQRVANETVEVCQELKRQVR
jgi:hypothetical protein